MPQDQLLDHEYDGIQEYDNPCPGWWHAIFLATVVFSVVYFLFFQVGNNGWTLAEAWNAAKTADMKERFSGMGELHNDTATILKYMKDPDWMVYANSVFSPTASPATAPTAAAWWAPT